MSKKGIERPALKREIPPHSGLLDKLARESAKYLLAQPNSKVTHGNVVIAVQQILRNNEIAANDHFKYYELIEKKVTDLALHPEKMQDMPPQPKHQMDLLPETDPQEQLELKPMPDGSISIAYQGHQYFGRLSEWQGKKVVIIRRGRKSISLSKKQYNFLRKKAHAMFAKIEENIKKNTEPEQDTFL